MTRKVSEKRKILVVDDDEKILFAFSQVFAQDGYRCITAKRGEDALTIAASEKPDVIFMDIAMPGLNGLETLRRLKAHNAAVPVIMITGYGTMQTAIKAIQFGAFDYLTKPLDVEKIREEVKKALPDRARNSFAYESQSRFKADVIDRYELIGSTPAMQEIYKLIGSVAMTPNHTSVLITGESGTGKELVARAILYSGPAASEPFTAINCTALPESLLESELFGHEKGAFTGAIERKLGKFEVAGRGTIFLDEIGTLSAMLQQKLLRVLQERECERVGGNEPFHIEARFVAATNVDLEAEVSKKRFREDLFFRLHVVAIHLPPLRERKDDIPLLAGYFLKKYAERIKKPVAGFSDETMQLLMQYSYPGNIRQLENIIERAVIFSKGDIILPENLQEKATVSTSGLKLLPIVSPVFSESRSHILEMFEKQFVIEQLKKHRGSVTAAARESKMTRQNFQRLMKKFKISAERFRHTGG
ncbi:MAG: sigma-54-dependent Fis family transcriptional regulator [Bacteroidota bacterium]|nr:sigma-54-dependent Fis family transcriptional regulator [Bacteroidota bacterium]